MDYMVQVGKEIPDGTVSTSDGKTIDYDTYLNNMQKIQNAKKLAPDGESTEIPEELRKRYEKMWILPYVK